MTKINPNIRRQKLLNKEIGDRLYYPEVKRASVSFAIIRLQREFGGKYRMRKVKSRGEVRVRREK